MPAEHVTKLVRLEHSHRRLCVRYGHDLGLIDSTATTAIFAGTPAQVLARANHVHEEIAARQRRGDPGFAYEPGDFQSTAQRGSLRGGDYQVFGAVKRRLKAMI